MRWTSWEIYAQRVQPHQLASPRISAVAEAVLASSLLGVHLTRHHWSNLAHCCRKRAINASGWNRKLHTHSEVIWNKVRAERFHGFRRSCTIDMQPTSSKVVSRWCSAWWAIFYLFVSLAVICDRQLERERGKTVVGLTCRSDQLVHYWVREGSTSFWGGKCEISGDDARPLKTH